MSELNIRINIAGRSYPLSIKRDQEESLRRVAKQIEEHIDKLRKSYAVKDNQDVLAMALLEFASRADGKETASGEAMSMNMLGEIDKLLTQLN